METRYWFYVVFVNWSALAVVLVNRMENPNASLNKDLTFLGLVIGVQLMVVASVNMPRLVAVFRKRN